MPDDVTMSDRELDEAVARAIGAPEVTEYSDLGQRAIDDRDSVILFREDGDVEWKPMRPGHGAFRPSTDIAAAWLVVLEMTRIGVPFAIEDSAASGTWRADFGGFAVTGEHECRGGAPRAICLAALAVLESVAAAKGHHAPR